MSQKIKCRYGRLIIGDLIKEDSVKKIKEIFKISDLEYNKIINSAKSMFAGHSLGVSLKFFSGIDNKGLINTLTDVKTL